jgi:sulfatase maturation enzyme AslB (radical SAM superfamily)
VNHPAQALGLPNVAKFENPDITAKGERRARVPLHRLETVWFNTGTLCNITCANCYIESSPKNDRLVYLSAAEVSTLLDELLRDGSGTSEIGFTGGEPFMNPAFLDILRATLERGFDVLVLTNAMQPLQRAPIKQGLLALKEAHGARLRIRVSLDHFTPELHEAERGPKSWSKAIAGVDWLNANGFEIAIAGRTCWGETEAEERNGYAALIAMRGWRIDPANPKQLMLLPEMDGSHDVPEITTACWSILHKSPQEMMCAKSRMVVKRKGSAAPVIVPCTLLPYEPAFEMGTTFAEAAAADTGMFADGAVKLCHPHCAKFCVLGGGSCS